MSVAGDDRGGLLPAVICAFISQVAYYLVTQWLIGNRAAVTNPATVALGLFHAATLMLPIAIILVPVITLVANFFDRRGSFSVVLQQEYAVLASVVFYALIATNLITLLIALALNLSGIQSAVTADLVAQGPQTIAMWRSAGASPGWIAEQEKLLNNPIAIAAGLFGVIKGLLFVGGIGLAVREVFRPSVLRTIVIVLSPRERGQGRRWRDSLPPRGFRSATA